MPGPAAWRIASRPRSRPPAIPTLIPDSPSQACEDVARSGLSALAGQSSGRSTTGPGAFSFDHRGREEASGAVTEPRHTAISGAPGLGWISVPGSGGGGLKRSVFVM